MISLMGYGIQGQGQFALAQAARLHSYGLANHHNFRTAKFVTHQRERFTYHYLVLDRKP